MQVGLKMAVGQCWKRVYLFRFSGNENFSHRQQPISGTQITEGGFSPSARCNVLGMAGAQRKFSLPEWEISCHSRLDLCNAFRLHADTTSQARALREPRQLGLHSGVDQLGLH